SIALGRGELRGSLDPQLHARACGDGAQGDELRILADERGDGVVLAAARYDEQRVGDMGEEVRGDADALHAVGSLNGNGEAAAGLLQMLGAEERGGVAVGPDPQQGEADPGP